MRHETVDAMAPLRERLAELDATIDLHYRRVQECMDMADEAGKLAREAEEERKELIAKLVKWGGR